jgi:flavin-binding protein dodecin
MSTIQIENLSDELYQSIQKLATDNSISISDAIIQLLTQADQPDASVNQHNQIHQLIKNNTGYSKESLKDAILDAIERANPSYEPAMAAALSEAMETIDNAPTMSTDEFREWLAEV